MRGVVGLFLLCVCAFSAPVFEHIHEFSLKKDQRASVEIRELAYPEQKQNFDFYWTLFDTNKIIVHSKYRRFARQFHLALKRNLNWASQTLVPDYSNPHIDRARLILEFAGFSQNEAKFKIYIEDKEARLEVNFLDPSQLEYNQTSPATRIVPGIIFNEEQNSTAGFSMQNDASKTPPLFDPNAPTNTANQGGANQNQAPADQN